jgi:hypothetical protein
MPEGPEVRIMSDFIKKNTEHKLYKKMFDVHKENTEYENQIIKDFYVYSQSDGKLLTLSFFNDDNHIYSTLINNYNFIKYNNKPTYYIDQPLCIDNILINNKNKHTLMVPNIITNENNMFKKYHSDHLPLSLNIKF